MARASSRRWLIKPQADLITRPLGAASLDDQLLFGQAFDVLAQEAGYLHIRPIALTGNAGNAAYILADSSFYTDEALPPNHKVTALKALVFNAPDIKAPVKMTLSLGSLLRTRSNEDGFYHIDEGYIHVQHVSDVDNYVSDWVDVALSYLGLPYYWGGRSADGVDCSGLVQNALWAAGIACPRNSGEQAKALGKALDISAGLPPLKRGDLIFWAGHVGIMVDADNLLHANAFHMKTVIESLYEVIARIDKSAGPMTAIRRLSLGGKT